MKVAHQTISYSFEKNRWLRHNLKSKCIVSMGHAVFQIGCMYAWWTWYEGRSSWRLIWFPCGRLDSSIMTAFMSKSKATVRSKTCQIFIRRPNSGRPSLLLAKCNKVFFSRLVQGTSDSDSVGLEQVVFV